MSLSANTGIQARMRVLTLPANLGHMDRAGEMAQNARYLDVILESPDDLQLANFGEDTPDVDSQGFVWIKKNANGVPIQIYGWDTVAESWQAIGISASDTWDPASIAKGDSVTTTIAVPGAVMGDFVIVSFSGDLLGLTLTGYVSAADTVTVVLANLSATDPRDLPSGDLYVRIIQNVHTP